MKFLKNHLFAVEAQFDSSVVLTFAVPKDQLCDFIPACLELDTFQDKWAFIAIAMVQTKNLRPKGFPKFMGSDFFLIGYRIFVRYTNTAGRRLRGLYIIKSETNKKKMEFLGNIFTHYSYSTTDIFQGFQGTKQIISSKKSNFELIYNTTEGEVALPPDSPFSDWKDARKFAGPLPHTFTFNKEDGTVLIIRGLRQKWKPKPLHIESYNFEYLKTLNLKNIVLANAFEIKNIPYEWEKGKLEKWK